MFQRFETGNSDWGDSCENAWTEEEMDALVREIVEAGGGPSGYDAVPGRYQEIVDRELQEFIMDHDDSSSDACGQQDY